MKVRVPIIVKDPEVTQDKEIEPTELFTVAGEDFFLDGPVTPRVAVLDFDATTGQLMAGAPFERMADGTSGTYRLGDPRDLAAHDVTQVSVFGTVQKVMAMFEEPDALGRKLTWAFEAPQLLVVPRAGEWANAFYERESHSLQFFYCRLNESAKPILTCHSQDIVAHETGHAVLDGIAPGLYNAISPQSLAIHEAVADLTALLCAFRSRKLRERVLEQTGGSIQNSSAFSGIAEQFGNAVDRSRTYLRDLLNTKSLDPDAEPNDRVDAAEPHDVSQVLSGALYTVMVQLHESLKDEYAQKRRAEPSLAEPAEQEADLAAAGIADVEAPVESLDVMQGEPRRAARQRVALKALAVAAERFKRTVFRGLDYLPPGEASFADFGRAMIAADQASHPESSAQRGWICDEFLRRSIVSRREDLDVETNFENAAVSALDLQTLIESDWAAYEFANRNRGLLGIPKGISFKVHPRLDVEKKYWYREGERTVRECIFKVSWSEAEPNRVGRGLPNRRQITVGTTLAIDSATRRVRARLTSDRSAELRERRDQLLTKLLDRDLLKVGDEAFGPDGRMLCAAIRAETLQGLLRVRGAARMLHIAPEV